MNDDLQAPLDDASPATADDAPAAAPAEATEPPAEVPAPAAVPAVPAAEEEAPPTSPEMPAAPANDPNVIDVIGHKQALDNEDALYAADVQRGAIHPKTLQSMYGEESTPGKIGTLFGLLLSGMGSGLSGQSNAVLDMMNNVIKNDVDAQQKSNDNAQNWLRLSQAHKMQKSQLGLLDSQIAGNDVDTATKLTQLAAFHKLQDVTKSLPEGGRARAMAEGMLNTVIAPGLQAQSSEINSRIAGRTALHQQLSNKTDPKKTAEFDPVNQDILNSLENDERFAGKIGAGKSPGVIATATQEAGRARGISMLYKAWKDAFEELDKSAVGGKINPQARKAKIQGILSMMGQAAGNTSNAQQAEFVESMFPGAEDWGSARADKAKYTAEHIKQMMAEATPTLTRLKAIRPLPAGPSISKNSVGSVGGAAKTIIDKVIGEKEASAKDGQKGEIPEGATGTHKGKPVVWHNGKWTYKK